MAQPASKKITAELRSAAKQIFHDDRDAFTVNNIRKAAVENLDLQFDFFKISPWKEKSKHIITEYSVSDYVLWPSHWNLC